MKKWEKNLVSVIAFVIMLVVAFATGAVYVEAETESIASSGKCGENVTWRIEEPNTLVIRGTGAMYSYNPVFSSAPWMEYVLNSEYIMRSGFKAVIEEGVTTIGNDVFWNNSYLTEISLPNGLIRIGDGAFGSLGDRCLKLKKITIPSSVKSIGPQAFIRSSVKEIWFEGNAPGFGTGTYADAMTRGLFGDVTATVYYPAGNNTWTSSVMQNYDGNLTWVAYNKTGTGEDSSNNAIKVSNINEAGVVLSQSTYKYDGYPKTPAVTVKYGGKILDSSNYFVTYKNNKYAGNASVEITGKGNYTGTVKKTFTITTGKQIKVLFNGNTGTVSKKQINVKMGAKYGILPAAKKKGYVFTGWFTSKTGGKKITEHSYVEANKEQTLYAQWKKELYNITYELNGGTNSKKNPDTYTVSSKTFSFANPSREGYVFKGWYTDSKFKKSIKKIAKGTTGNKTLYAKWSAITYNIKFNGNGATSGSMSQMNKILYAKETALKKNQFKKSGYTFKGWSTSKGGAVKYTDGQKISSLAAKQGKTITLYAVWSKISTPQKESYSDEKSYTIYFESAITCDNSPLTFSYSDQYFNNNSDTLNPKIAKASISLASAAYMKSQSGYILQQMGFSNVEQFNYDRSASMSDNNYVAFTIGKKTITINGTKKNLIAVLVRGTPGSYEWYSNFNVGMSGDHEGFCRAAEEIEEQVVSYLSGGSAANNILWITGHSRGAAVANILAGIFSQNYSAYVQRSNVYGYTFGCPAVSVNANTKLDNIHNFCNPGDIVTQVPLSFWGYKRNGSDEKMTNVNSIKTKFKEMTGVSFNGFVSRNSFVDNMEKWIPNVNELYSVKKVERVGYSRYMSKHNVLLAIVTFLVKNRESGDSKHALETIEDAFFGENMNLPWSILGAYLGNGIKVNGLGSLIDLTNGKVAMGDGMAHSHCQEFYYAWVSTMS